MQFGTAVFHWCEDTDKVGPVHFVSLNTETDFPGAEEAKTGAGGVRQG